MRQGVCHAFQPPRVQSMAELIKKLFYPRRSGTTSPGYAVHEPEYAENGEEHDGELYHHAKYAGDHPEEERYNVAQGQVQHAEGRSEIRHKTCSILRRTPPGGPGYRPARCGVSIASFLRTVNAFGESNGRKASPSL